MVKFEVNWRPVICGNLLQIALGFLILRWPPGYVGFNWLVEKVIFKFSYNMTIVVNE
jgi:nucleoside permease NupC